MKTTVTLRDGRRKPDVHEGCTAYVDQGGGVQVITEGRVNAGEYPAGTWSSMEVEVDD